VHLRERREAILAACRKAVDTDPHIPSASSLSKPQFEDHIPEMLDTFEQHLYAQSAPEKREAIANQKHRCRRARVAIRSHRPGCGA